MASHPAKFSDSILEVLDRLIPQDAVVLDPFAGVGKIHTLGRRSIGLEIEPEWATQAEGRTIVGDALRLPIRDAVVPCVATSPTYGNRMADHHNAKDGSRRMTYTHVLGRTLNRASSATLQWGEAYRKFHEDAWREVYRVLQPNGLFLLNVSNHIRKGQEIPVSEWHLATAVELNFNLESAIKISTPRMRRGENHQLRVEHENVYVLRKGSR